MPHRLLQLGDQDARKIINRLGSDWLTALKRSKDIMLTLCPKRAANVSGLHHRVAIVWKRIVRMKKMVATKLFIVRHPNATPTWPVQSAAIEAKVDQLITKLKRCLYMHKATCVNSRPPSTKNTKNTPCNMKPTSSANSLRVTRSWVTNRQQASAKANQQWQGKPSLTLRAT